MTPERRVARRNCCCSFSCCCCCCGCSYYVSECMSVCVCGSVSVSEELGRASILAQQKVSRAFWARHYWGTFWVGGGLLVGWGLVKQLAFSICHWFLYGNNLVVAKCWQCSTGRVNEWAQPKVVRLFGLQLQLSRVFCCQMAAHMSSGRQAAKMDLKW